MEIEKYRNFFPLNVHEGNKIQVFISFGIVDYVFVAFFSLMFSLIISGIYFSVNPSMDFIATGEEPLISIKVFIAMVCGFFALFAPILTVQTIFNSIWWRMKINPFNYSDENLAKIMSVFNVVYKNDYFTGTERYKEIAEIVNGRKSETSINQLFLEAISSCEVRYDKDQKNQQEEKIRNMKASIIEKSAITEEKIKAMASTEARKELLLKSLSKMK